MFRIENREISEKHPPYIIAELSANHNGSIERAKLSIKSAKENGADAVKIQTYTPDTMTIDCENSDFILKEGLWKGYKLYDLYNEAQTPFEWHHELFKYARDLGITLFSTPFDESAIDLLEALNTPAYKIASFELTDLPLIGYAAKTKKPLLMSTGMATEVEIAEALEVARSGGCNSILLFHCISSYPTPIDQANLKQLEKIKKTFDVLIGLSDHTVGNIAAISSIPLGACAIEKHFTLSRKDKGPDSEFSMEPGELKTLARDTKDAWASLGISGFSRPRIESANKVFRRSIYFISDMKAGDRITENDIKRIRPGFGIPPKYFNSLIGRRVTLDIKRGDAVTWDLIEK
jgi:pseudaminic acid synthase